MQPSIPILLGSEGSIQQFKPYTCDFSNSSSTLENMSGTDDRLPLYLLNICSIFFLSRELTAPPPPIADAAPGPDLCSLK